LNNDSRLRGSLGLGALRAEAWARLHPTLLVIGLMDLDTGRLVDVLPARSATAVRDWLAAKPAPWLERIRHVVIDPYQPYASAVAERCPRRAS
jgi:transposase